MTWSKLKPFARWAYAGCQALWSAGFALAGRFDHQSLSQWSPLGAGRVLVIAPHPDDECTGCGGTIVLHCRAGDCVTVLQITDGQGVHAPQFNGERMALVRQREARAAAVALGVTGLEQLALPERMWREEQLRVELRARLIQIDPDIVYAPSCIDFHPDHLRVARALAVALADMAERPRIRVYEITVPLSAQLANCIADTSSVIDAHDAAIAAYRSQVHVLRSVIRLRTYRTRYYRMTRGAEVFWELSPGDYRKLMACGDWLGARDWSSRGTPFRSLRDRPFTDPFAFGFGQAVRRRLKRLITAGERSPVTDG